MSVMNKPRIAVASALLGIALFLFALVALGSPIDGNATGGARLNEPTVQVRILNPSSSVSQEQAAALADGVITGAEYEAAIWAAFACIRDLGNEPIQEPSLSPDGFRLQFSFVSNPGTRNAALDCHQHHSMLVEMKWAAQHTASPEQSAAARRSFHTCLLEAGFPEGIVAAARDAQVLADYGSPAFGPCYQATLKQFGTIGY
jgi:hypothetical protein